MSRRTLLIAALALMAGGLLLGGIGTVLGGGFTPVQSHQPFFGPNGQQGQQGQQGPEGGLPPGRPGIGPETEQGEGNEEAVPPRAASPRPTPTP